MESLVRAIWSRRTSRENFPARRRVNRQILGFSFCIGMTATLLTAGVYSASIYHEVEFKEQAHSRALSEVKCADATCNLTDFENDWQSSPPDYLIYKPTRYFLVVPESQEQEATFAPLDFVDSAFIERFGRATSYDTPDGARWRMFSRNAVTNFGRHIQVFIGYEENAPWKMVTTTPSVLPKIDAELKREADGIADTYRNEEWRAPPGPRLRADGYAVMDASTGQVLKWGSWLPIFLPTARLASLPDRHFRLYVSGSDLYGLLTDPALRNVCT